MADLIFPPSPTDGEEFTGTFGEIYTWDGEKWSLTAGGSGPPAGGASVTVSDTPPASPAQGDLWWDTVSGQLFIWYIDANSAQWVVANVSVGVPGPAGPAGPNVMPPGVTDGSNAAAGQVGEYITASMSSTLYGLTNADSALTSISLTAGDWEVWGAAQFYLAEPAPPFDGIPAGSIIRWMLRTSSFTGTEGNAGVELGPAGALNNGALGLVTILQTGIRRVNTSTLQTVTLTANATRLAGTGGSATCQGGAFVAARRMR